MTQVVKFLPCKHKGLSSISSTTTKKHINWKWKECKTTMVFLVLRKQEHRIPAQGLLAKQSSCISELWVWWQICVLKNYWLLLNKMVFSVKILKELGMVVHACSPSYLEADYRVSLEFMS